MLRVLECGEVRCGRLVRYPSFFFCIFVFVERIEIRALDCSRMLVWCLCLLFSL
jgi:hypothetical protein